MAKKDWWTISYQDIDRIDINRTNGHRGILLELMGDDRIMITSSITGRAASESLRSNSGRDDSPHR